MDLEAWRLASPWLDEALELTPAERDAWLSELERAQPAVVATLRKLFDGHDHPVFEGFLATTATVAGRRCGPYVLERELGVGGMGSVWLARRDDGRFEGKVAIKLSNVQRLTRAGGLRFAREGALLARLSHPHVARLLDAGVADGQPYLVLEYVDGLPIDAWCDARALPVRARVRLFLDVLDAVAHAHMNLVLHRDLKPSNILVDAEQGVKLLDFGVAKLVRDASHAAAETELTREAGRAFTPAFAAPEQERGEPMTTASDVYSLGVVLYLLLSGRHPLATASAPGRTFAPGDPSPLATLPRATAAAVAVARSTTAPGLARELRGDLQNIVGKALKLVPTERYPTAGAFAADLRRYLNSEPITARRDSFSYRASKFISRHRLAVSAASVVFLALGMGVVGTTWQAVEAQHQRRAALLEARRADQSRLFMRLMVSEIGDGSRPVTGLDILDRGTALLRDQAGRDPRFVADEMIQMATFYDSLKQTNRERELLTEAERMARAISAHDVLARALCEAADLDLTVNQRPQALRRLTEARQLLAAHEAPAIVVVGCLSTEANALDAAGDVRGAIAQAQVAVDTLVAAGKGTHPLHSALLSRISNYHYNLGEQREAFEFNRQAALAQVADGTASTVNGLVVRNNYAVDLTSFGEYSAAAAVADDISARARVRGPVPVDLSANRGGMLSAVGRYAESDAILDDTIARADASGNEFWGQRARFFRARSLVWQNRLVEADAALTEIEQAYGRNPEQNRSAIVSTAAVRADWLSRSGRGAEACVAMETLLHEIGYPGGSEAKRYLSTVVPLAAQIALAAGRADRAFELAGDGVKHAEAAARDVPASGDVGRARLVLGRVMIAKGDKASGRTMIESALSPLTRGFGSEHWLVVEARAALAAMT